MATRWGEQNARAAAVLLLSLGNSAFVYQGEELGMVDGPVGDPPRDRFGRDGCRRPMQWDASATGGFTSGTPWLEPVDPGDRSVDAQSPDDGSVLNLFRRLIALRGELAGEPRRVDSPPGTLVFDRGRHRIAINLGDDAAAMPLPETAVVLLETAAGVARPAAGGRVEVDGHAAIVARAA